MTFANLASAIASLRAEIPKLVSVETVKIAKVVLKVASENTPVDTTKAISNWQVGVGNAPTNVLNPYVPGSGGSTQIASIIATNNVGAAKLNRRKYGQTIHIVNNADYIEGLNDGSISRQPGGFVEKAIVAGNKALLAANIDLSRVI